MDYKQAGVDVEAGYEAVSLYKPHIRRTAVEGVLGGIGSFGGFFSLKAFTDMEEPVLVSGTDGVGTKLKIAFTMDKHDTVGVDAVAMCVNDIVCQGASPLFFLDYLAMGRLEPKKAAEIVKGVADGCVQAGCALVGGETAEMPGIYAEGEYDLAGFAVGVADRRKIITGAGIRAGDALIGLTSSGVHSNGFSLIRKLMGETPADLREYIPEFGKTAGEELLIPTRIYVKTILALMKEFEIKGIAHITGGGFIENIPRILPQGLKAVIRGGTWEIPPVFQYLQKLGGIQPRSIYNTYNMGIGMVLAVDAGKADALTRRATELGDKAYIIGEVAEGIKAGEAGEGVELCL
jgi:phosphoribosylformylglycinamidine cyclo-ligase